MKRITAAIVLVCLAAIVGLTAGPRPADVERIMATQEYKADEAAHLTKWEIK